MNPWRLQKGTLGKSFQELHIERVNFVYTVDKIKKSELNTVVNLLLNFTQDYLLNMV